MGKYSNEAKEILNLIGGKENLISATHCVTRLRLVLKDEKLVDKEGLENSPSVKGCFSAAGQFQIIIGNQVKDFYKDFIQVAQIKEVSKEEVKKIASSKGNTFQKVIASFAEIFTPLLPAIITGGLILGFRNIIGDLAVFGPNENQTLTSIYPKLAELHSFLWILGEAIFHFLPVGVTWSTVKKYGGTEILGIVLGITLVSPQLLNAYGYASAQAAGAVPFWDFGFITIQKVGYQAQVIPAMLAGIFMVKFETLLKKHVPEILKMILVPFLVLFTTVVLSYLVIGPVSREIGNYIAYIFNVLLTGPFRVIGAVLFGMLYAPLVITGVHHTFLAVDLQLIAQGGTMIWPMIALSNIAQGSAAITVMLLNRKDEKIKSLSLSSAISAWLGVTEPAMFGVNLRFMYPFYGALIGSALAAVYSTISGVLANSIGIGGLPAFLAIQPRFWVNYIIAIIIAIIAPMVATYLLSKNKIIKIKK